MDDFDQWIESLTFKDDRVFQAVMRNEEICKEVLERILGFPLRSLSFPKAEWGIDNGLGFHSVRLDIYVEDEDGRMIDVEMQKVKDDYLPERSRYYQSMMDASTLRKGEKDYRGLPDSYIIFFCDFNPFDGEKMVYRFENRDEGREGIPLKDRAYRIFLCTKGKKADARVEILSLLSYLKGENATDSLTERIRREVESLKQDSKWRRIMWENHAHEMDLRREGREEAHAEDEAAYAAEQARLVLLVHALQGDGRTDDVVLAVEDKGARERLLKEYGIE